MPNFLIWCFIAFYKPFKDVDKLQERFMSLFFSYFKRFDSETVQKKKVFLALFVPFVETFVISR